MDIEKLAAGQALGAEALTKPTENSRREAKSIPREAKPLYRLASEVSGLPLYSIYELVNTGVLTVYLSSETDWHLLKSIFPRIIRSKRVMKSLTSRLSKSDRQEIVEYAGEGTIESYLRRQIEANPDIPRTRLLMLAQQRFAKINWAERDATGKTQRQKYALLIRRIRDRVKAKIRYRQRVPRLDEKEIEYFRGCLLEAIESKKASLSDERFVETQSFDEIKRIAEIIADVTHIHDKGRTSTLDAFSRAFGQLGRQLPLSRKEFLYNFDTWLIDAARKLGPRFWDEFKGYRVALQDMSYTEIRTVRARLDHFECVYRIEEELRIISEDLDIQPSDQCKAKSLLEKMRCMPVQDFQDVLVWIQAKKKEMRPF